MSKCILFIDGENFLHKVEEVFKAEGINKSKAELAPIDLNELFKDPLKGLSISRKIFYVSSLRFYPETKRKSEASRDWKKPRNNIAS
jgi:hypothetical protein